MITDTIASTHLGKKSTGSEVYDPSLLVVIPRAENRKQYNIENNYLPFEGFDVWHAYEFSCLTEKGLPVTRLLKIKYSCQSEYLVESKSLKLYLNSYNMTRFGKNTKECIDICRTKIQKDLSERLKTDVVIEFLDNDTQKTEIFSDYTNIMTLVDESDINITEFKESPNVLRTDTTGQINTYKLTFDSLRSNCRVTHQPDFGDVFIYYKSQKHIDEKSLITYLTSFRSEYHFHEECCEMIYKRLHDILDKDDELMVCALYTRRGGIDICPARHSKNCSVKDYQDLFEINKLTRYGVKQ